MPAVYELPLSGAPQRFQVTLAGTTYALTFQYRDAIMGGWFLDIADVNQNPLACGIPLVTGTDLLAPFPDLGFAGQLFVTTDGDPAATPTFDNLGTTSHVYFVVPDAPTMVSTVPVPLVGVA